LPVSDRHGFAAAAGSSGCQAELKEKNRSLEEQINRAEERDRHPLAKVAQASRKKDVQEKYYQSPVNWTRKNKNECQRGAPKGRRS